MRWLALLPATHPLSRSCYANTGGQVQCCIPRHSSRHATTLYNTTSPPRSQPNPTDLEGGGDGRQTQVASCLRLTCRDLDGPLQLGCPQQQRGHRLQHPGGKLKLSPSGSMDQQAWSLCTTRPKLAPKFNLGPHLQASAAEQTAARGPRQRLAALQQETEPAAGHVNQSNAGAQLAAQLQDRSSSWVQGQSGMARAQRSRCVRLLSLAVQQPL